MPSPLYWPTGGWKVQQGKTGNGQIVERRLVATREPCVACGKTCKDYSNQNRNLYQYRLKVPKVVSEDGTPVMLVPEEFRQIGGFFCNMKCLAKTHPDLRANRLTLWSRMDRTKSPKATAMGRRHRLAITFEEAGRPYGFVSWYAEQSGLSRQRIHQILSKHYGGKIPFDNDRDDSGPCG